MTSATKGFATAALDLKESHDQAEYKSAKAATPLMCKEPNCTSSVKLTLPAVRESLTGSTGLVCALGHYCTVSTCTITPQRPWLLHDGRPSSTAIPQFIGKEHRRVFNWWNIITNPEMILVNQCQTAICLGEIHQVKERRQIFQMRTKLQKRSRLWNPNGLVQRHYFFLKQLLAMWAGGSDDRRHRE